MSKKINKLTADSKEDINDPYYLIPILEEIEQSLTEIKLRLDNLETPK
tara:strand:- start:44 stop:187 length:144 start_codon:yes stop_codon:yes gene_type:complete